MAVTGRSARRYAARRSLGMAQAGPVWDRWPVSTAPSPRLLRLSGLAAALGGASIAAFVLLHPWDRFTDPAAARSDQWRVAHTLHFVGASLTVLGLVGLW